MKIHVALDGERGMVLSVEVTGSEVADGTVVPEVIAGVKERVHQVIADGGYDWRKVYEALMKHTAGVKIVIPPRRGGGGAEGGSDGLWTASAGGKLSGYLGKVCGVVGEIVRR